MITIKRIYTFSAAHRLEGHPKCGRMHGHNYIVEVEASAVMRGDPIDWVMDFAVLDDIVRPVLDELDHRYIYGRHNEQLCPYLETAISLGHAKMIPYYETTAENLVRYLEVEIGKTLRQVSDVVIESLTVHETARSSATISHPIRTWGISPIVSSL